MNELSAIITGRLTPVRYWTNSIYIYISIYLPIYLSIYSSTALVDLGHFFSFLILHTVGRTPWTVDQAVARPLPIHRTTQTQNKCTQTSIPRVEIEPTIPVCERAKTVHALDRAATLIGIQLITKQKFTVAQITTFPNFHGTQLCSVHIIILYMLEVLFNNILSLLWSFTLSLSFGFSD
jgi:hypothetical protein